MLYTQNRDIASPRDATMLLHITSATLAILTLHVLQECFGWLVVKVLPQTRT